jgi:dissimilatory sulfite reductase (desulfoviridin) alpha/beta subunit
VKTCREAAIFMQGSRAVTRAEDCLVCGECARSCPANAIRCEPLGFRLLLGGHMGRHPAWATELHGLCLPDRIPHMIACLVRLLICEAREGERPSQTFARLGFAYIEQHIGVKKYE